MKTLTQCHIQVQEIHHYLMSSLADFPHHEMATIGATTGMHIRMCFCTRC